MFLEYASTFLSNIGNYYVRIISGQLSGTFLNVLQGHGDQKFVPSLSLHSLGRLAERSVRLRELFRMISEPMTMIPPYALGFPSEQSQSCYYPGPEIITREETAVVSQALEARGILPENTRVRKINGPHVPRYEVLQASVDQDTNAVEFFLPNSRALVRIRRGDHSEELEKICSCLSEAAKYAASEKQRIFLSQYVESFQTGDLHVYRDSLRTWIGDKSPRVENIFGFVEPYRDPYGIRAEFEGLVGISDAQETERLMKLVQHSDIFIKRLPWVGKGHTENNGKGPFEKALFEPPDFASIHGKANSLHLGYS
jgi:dipeptidyl-peptidase-3